MDGDDKSHEEPPMRDPDEPPEGGWWTDWGVSEGTAKLREWCESGKVTQDMEPALVQKMHPYFQRYKPQNFANNYRRLQQSILTEQKSLAFDKEAYDHDTKLHPTSDTTSHGLPRFNKSEVERIMIEKLKEPRFEKYLDGGKYTVDDDDDPQEKKQHLIPHQERVALYLENYAENSKFGYERWSHFLSQKLVPTRSKFLFKKKYNVGKKPESNKPQINELSPEDEEYLENH